MNRHSESYGTGRSPSSAELGKPAIHQDSTPRFASPSAKKRDLERHASPAAVGSRGVFLARQELAALGARNIGRVPVPCCGFKELDDLATLGCVRNEVSNRSSAEIGVFGVDLHGSVKSYIPGHLDPHLIHAWIGMVW